MKKNKRLYRSKSDRFFAGVCGGLAEYLEIPSSTVRLIWIIAMLVSAGTLPLVLYLILWFSLPESPEKPNYQETFLTDLAQKIESELKQMLTAKSKKSSSTSSEQANQENS